MYLYHAYPEIYQTDAGGKENLHHKIAICQIPVTTAFDLQQKFVVLRYFPSVRAVYCLKYLRHSF